MNAAAAERHRVLNQVVLTSLFRNSPSQLVQLAPESGNEGFKSLCVRLCVCMCVSVCVLQVRHGSRCRSVCERARGSVAGRGLIQRRGLALERTAPDRLSSTPGTQPTTAGDWPTACQSTLAPPPCPMGMQKHRRSGSLFNFVLLNQCSLKNADKREAGHTLKGIHRFWWDLISES